jgi:hypothetical protein
VSKIIDLGCRVADVHHRYQAIHDALFGAASLRLIFDALRGRRRRAYKDFALSLEGLQEELISLRAQTSDLAGETPAKVTDRELQRLLLEYSEALRKAITALDLIFTRLEQNESAYREVDADGRSGFTRDKVQYDHLLLDLERLGGRLNRLFSNY